MVPKAAAYDAAAETAKIRARELSKLRWAHPPAHYTEHAKHISVMENGHRRRLKKKMADAEKEETRKFY